MKIFLRVLGSIIIVFAIIYFLCTLSVTLPVSLILSAAVFFIISSLISKIEDLQDRLNDAEFYIDDLYKVINEINNNINDEE